MAACIGTTSLTRRADVLVALRPALRRYFRRRLPSSVDDADDLIQEVCARFLALPETAAPVDEWRYLFGIARHVWADFLAERARQRRHLVSSEELPPGTMLHTAESPSDPAREALTSQFVAFLLQHLPKTQKAVLLTHEQEGYSYAETAARLGLSVHTVHTYLKSAKSQLRKLAR